MLTAPLAHQIETFRDYLKSFSSDAVELLHKFPNKLVSILFIFIRGKHPLLAGQSLRSPQTF